MALQRNASYTALKRKPRVTFCCNIGRASLSGSDKFSSDIMLLTLILILGYLLILSTECQHC
jgi:hypothetical protein